MSAHEPVPILMYHRIRSGRCPVPGGDPEETRYAVDLSEFKWQMAWLQDSGYVAVSLGRVLRAPMGGEDPPGRRVVLTFDDGNLSDFEHAAPLLEERGFSGTFFVGGNRVDQPGGLERRMIAELDSRGMEIGSHGMTHRFLNRLAPAQQEAECRGSRELLAEIIGGDVRYFACPGGRYNRHTLMALRAAGYEAACTSRLGYFKAMAHPYELPRIPVVLGTRRDVFQGLVGHSARVVWPAYLRAGVLRAARGVLSDGPYRRIRAMVIKG